MPVYVYKNLRTGEKFEVEQRITEPALTEHPESGDPVKRLIQPVGIAFKGSGFYVNDSRNGSSKSTGKSSAKSDSESKSSAGSEVKAESKSSTGEKAGTGDSKSSSAKSD